MKTSQIKLWHLFLLCVAVVFAVHWSYLFKGHFNDDYALLGHWPGADMYKGKAFPFLGDVHTLRDAVEVFNPFRGWYFRPFFLLWGAALFAVVGDNIVFWHGLSLLIHAANVFLIGYLALRLTGNKAIGLLAALLFLVFPGKAQAVWWVASQSTLLCLFLALLSMHFWLSYREENENKYSALALLFMIFALGMKNEAVFLPFAFVLFDWHQSKRLSVIHALAFVLLIGFVWCEITASRGVAAQIYGELKPALEMTPYVRMHLAWQFVMALLSGWVILVAGSVIQWASEGRKDKTLPVLLTLLVVTAVPVPISAGDYAFQERFFYVPAMGAALLLAYCGYGYALVFREYWQQKRNPHQGKAEPITDSLVCVDG